MTRDRDDDGRYVEALPPSAFVEAIDSLDEHPTTTDVAEEVGCTRRHARTRLGELEAAGEVVHEEVANAFVWSLLPG